MIVLLYERCSGRYIVLLTVLCITKIYGAPKPVCPGPISFTRVRCFSDFKDTIFEEYRSLNIPLHVCADKCSRDSICTCFYFDGHAETPICKLYEQVSPVVQTFPQEQRYFLKFEGEGKKHISVFKYENK